MNLDYYLNTVKMIYLCGIMVRFCPERKKYSRNTFMSENYLTNLNLINLTNLKNI